MKKDKQAVEQIQKDNVQVVEQIQKEQTKKDNPKTEKKNSIASYGYWLIKNFLYYSAILLLWISKNVILSFAILASSLIALLLLKLRRQQK